MGNVDYSYPLPEKNIIKRFNPVFKALNKGYSATLLALPFTGRTSNLRYICNNPELQRKIGLKTNAKRVVFVDIDQSTSTYESFLLELLEQLKREQIHSSWLQDRYLLNKELFRTVSEITKNKEVILMITLNQKVLSFAKDLDQVVSLTQKSTSKYSLSVLWSIDTEVFRKFTKNHPSSTFGQNIFYFPTFDEKETLYSFKRIQAFTSLNKYIEAHTNFYKLTAGVAGLFHSFANFDGDLSIWDSELTQFILKTLHKEIENNKNIIDNLLKPEVLNLVDTYLKEPVAYKSIKLLSNPTAQEINILNFLLKNSEKPISRDEIAQVLWGKAWNSKYSDWAIDKTIGRLRKKLLGNEIKILTVKNYGYQLFKLS